jgi:hypothetical protein
MTTFLAGFRTDNRFMRDESVFGVNDACREMSLSDRTFRPRSQVIELLLRGPKTWRFYGMLS